MNDSEICVCIEDCAILWEYPGYVRKMSGKLEGKVCKEAVIRW